MASWGTQMAQSVKQKRSFLISAQVMISRPWGRAPSGALCWAWSLYHIFSLLSPLPCLPPWSPLAHAYSLSLWKKRTWHPFQRWNTFFFFKLQICWKNGIFPLWPTKVGWWDIPQLYHFFSIPMNGTTILKAQMEFLIITLHWNKNNLPNEDILIDLNLRHSSYKVSFI